MTTQTIPRALLGQLSSNPQVIRYLEQIGEDAVAAPLALEQVQGIAEQAQATASSAGVLAQQANRLADMIAVERATNASLHAQVRDLARRLAVIETLVQGTRL